MKNNNEEQEQISMFVHLLLEDDRYRSMFLEKIVETLEQIKNNKDLEIDLLKMKKVLHEFETLQQKKNSLKTQEELQGYSIF